MDSVKRCVDCGYRTVTYEEVVYCSKCGGRLETLLRRVEENRN